MSAKSLFPVTGLVAQALSTRLDIRIRKLANFMHELLGGAVNYSRQKIGCLDTLFKILPRLLITVALTELVDLLGGLQDVLLTGVKRMRLARNFKL